MSYQRDRNRKNHEQKIKHRLFLIDWEDNDQNNQSSIHLYDYCGKGKLKNTRDHDITDWMNSKKSVQLSKPFKNDPVTPKPDYKKLIGFDSTRYSSCLLSKTSSKNNRIQLNPIAAKFNSKLLSRNLQRSRQNFMQRPPENPYLTHYKAISKKSSEKQSLRLKQLKISINQTSMNKTQRNFGLLYLLKRRDSAGKPQKRYNPEDLTVLNSKWF